METLLLVLLAWLLVNVLGALAWAARCAGSRPAGTSRAAVPGPRVTGDDVAPVRARATL